MIPDQLSFTIEMEDEAGNFVFVDQTSDNSNITIDLEAPEISVQSFFQTISIQLDSCLSWRRRMTTSA